MERVKVQSSAVAELGYDDETQTLEVLFHPNRAGIASLWHYRPVARAAYDEMFAEGASVGKLLQGIRSNPEISAYKAGEEAPAVAS